MVTRSRREFERRARRLEALLHDVEALGDARARRSALDAVRALLDLHGDVLARMLELAGPELAAAMGDDEVVGGLLLLHGVHPVSLEDRVARALARVGPYLGSHGGGVRVVGIEDGVARLRLEGSCHGCPSSTATIRYTIEQALAEAAPELARVEVEGVAGPAPGPGFVAVGSIGRAQPRAEWHAVDGPVEPGRVEAREVAGLAIALCAVGDHAYAYRDRCPACAASVAGRRLDGEAIRCPACGRAFDARLAGRCPEDPALYLEPVPLLVRDGEIRVAVPEPAGAV